MDNEINIKQIVQGNKQAFKSLFDLYFKPLCAFAYNYVKEVDTIEDFVQESFIRFWENRKGFKDAAAVKSYLYTSVKNKCFNHLKHLQVKKKNEESIAFEICQLQMDEMVIEEETFALLYAEINKLPEASQKIMLLALNGLKNPEIAKELNVSVNTVKTQKKIAYARLKERISLPTLLLFFM